MKRQKIVREENMGESQGQESRTGYMEEKAFLAFQSKTADDIYGGADAAYRGSAENVCELWRDYGSGWNGRKTVVLSC